MDLRATHKPSQMLVVRSLCKSYGQKSVLQDFNLTLQSGEIVFLTGPSGSGKSTALRAIANLDASDSGSLALEGRSPAELGFARWRCDVAYVPQCRIAHNCTPRDLFVRALNFAARSERCDNVEQRAEKYVQLCVTVGLERAQVVKQKWGELSGGELVTRLLPCLRELRPMALLRSAFGVEMSEYADAKRFALVQQPCEILVGQAQRASVCLSIALRPRVLLLDEPTSSCDQQSALLVERAISESGIAAVWVSHDVDQSGRVGGRIQNVNTNAES